MSILNTTRKLLWSRAHNSCALCKKPLTVDAESAELPGVVLGEEAHITARREDGPRGRDEDRSDIDGYDNIVLLCADDHKRVDMQPEVFSVSYLRQLKIDHEKWAARKFAGQPYHEPIRLVRALDEDAVPFSQVTTGRELWELFDQTYARYFSTVEDAVSPEAASASDMLLDTSSEWADISAEVTAQGFAAVREAQASLQEMLDEVSSYGLLAFGRRLTRSLVGGAAPPAPWPIVQLTIVTKNQVQVAV